MRLHDFGDHPHAGVFTLPALNQTLRGYVRAVGVAAETISAASKDGGSWRCTIYSCQRIMLQDVS